MTSYKFRFEQSPKRKGSCPKCEKPGVFRYYEGLDRAFGKCDRDNNCGYHNKPTSTTIKEDGLDTGVPLLKIIKPPLKVITKVHSGKDTNFHRFCDGLGIGADHLVNWGVGSEDTRTAFIHFNKEGGPVNIKFICYDEGGHRIKKRTPSYLKATDTGVRYGQCLYGLHKIDDEKVTCLVESEKTAVIASFFYPQFNWLATGGSHGLSQSKMEELRGLKLIYIADADKAGRQNSSIRNLGKGGLDVKILELFNGRTDGYDLADAIAEGQKPVIPNLFEENETPVDISKLWLDEKTISRSGYLEVLRCAGGYFGYRVDDSPGETQLVRCMAGVVEPIDPGALKIDFLKRIAFDRKTVEVFLRGATHYFGIHMLTSLPLIEGQFVKDDPRTVRVPFLNGLVQIDEKQITLVKYGSDGLIWKSDLVNRELKLINDPRKLESFEFMRFLKNIAGSDERLLALKTAIGYLLHSYPGENKAVILTDSTLSDEPEGRTGKSLLCKALGKIRVTTDIDGKNFKADNRFCYQDVTRQTRIVSFNDMGQNRKSFDLEQLFTAITEGVQVEKKNMATFRHYVKIVLSSNRPVKVDGGSARARAYEFELSNHYSCDYSPKDEFKRMFFDDWTAKDWILFDNCLLHCIQEYLRRGLVAVPAINLAERKLKDATTKDSTFLDFANEEIEIGKKYNKAEVLQRFKEANPEFATLQLRTFTKWLSKYALYRKCFLCSSRSDKTLYFSIVISS